MPSMKEDRRNEQMTTSLLMMMGLGTMTEVERSGSMKINMKREEMEPEGRRLENLIRKAIKILSNSCSQRVLLPTRRS